MPNIRIKTQFFALAPLILALIVTGVALPAAAAVAADQRILVLAEDAPPHSVLKDGQVSGTSTEFVRLLTAKAGLTPDIRLMNWKAALQVIDDQSAVLIYPIARTPERESAFYWIGRLAIYKTYFYKKKDRSDIQLKKLEDAQAYRVGAVRQDVRSTYLLANGFAADGKLLTGVSDNKEALRLLQIGRIDLTPLSRFAFDGACASMGSSIRCEQFEAAMPIDLTADIYLAASKKTPADTVRRLQAAYDSLVEDGSFSRLLGKYFKP